MKKLPVIKTMIGALYYPWVLRKPLFKALSILIVAGVVLSTVWWYQWGLGLIPEYIGWLVAIIFWTLYTLFAVICHRMVLLGVSSVPEYGVGRVGERDFRFAVALAILMIISMLAPYSVSLIIFLLLGIIKNLPFVPEFNMKINFGINASSWLFYIGQIFVLSRFGLILPATAVDERPTLKWAWRTSRGNTLRLMVVLGFLPWLVYLPSEFLPEDPGVTGYGLYVLTWWLLLPIEITVLSLSYKELVQEREQEKEQLVL
ncbi:MAG TPA: hypothetical protein VF268_15750 [Gammaproteobacteria bacterium]